MVLKVLPRIDELSERGVNPRNAWVAKMQENRKGLGSRKAAAVLAGVEVDLL